MTKALSTIPRYSIYALLIFTPLARASIQGWAITIIHMVTLIALTAFLLEKTWTWNWKWIKTPLNLIVIHNSRCDPYVFTITSSITPLITT